MVKCLPKSLEEVLARAAATLDAFIGDFAATCLLGVRVVPTRAAGLRMTTAAGRFVGMVKCLPKRAALLSLLNE